MLSEKQWHVLDVLFCVVGIVSGLSGGVSFSTIYSNQPATLWAYYSGCLAFACMVIELLRQHGLLGVCCTPFSLRVVSIYAFLSFVTTAILFLVHLSVGLKNREALTGKSAVDHSDFIVAVWNFLTAKFCLKLHLVSKKSRREMLQSVPPRAESPNFLQMHGHGPYAESLDSHITGRRSRRAPHDRRRSSSDTRRRSGDRVRRSGRRRRRSADRTDLLSNVSSMPTASQLAAETDSESPCDMDEAAPRLTLDL